MFLVPPQGQPEKLRLRHVNLLNRNAKPGGKEVVPTIPAGDSEETQEHLSVTENATETGASAPPHEVWYRCVFMRVVGLLDSDVMPQAFCLM